MRSQPADLSPHRATALCYAAMMCPAIAVNLMPVLLTTLAVDLGGPDGLTQEQLGRIGGVTFVGLVIGMAVAGPLADRRGPRPFAWGGSVVIAAGLAALALAPDYRALLAAVGLMGFGAGMLDMILSPIVAALQPHRRTSAMNWLHGFYGIGAVATVTIASVALRLGVGWRLITLALIALPAAMAAGFARVGLPVLVQAGQDRTRVRELVRRPLFLLALAAMFLGGATELGMAQWLPAYAESTLGFSRLTGGLALVAFSLALVVGRVAAGRIGHRIDFVRLLTIGGWLSAAAFAGACFAPWSGVALAACIASGLTASCFWPGLLGLAGDRFPHGGASMFALLSASGNFGGIFLPWLIGVVADASALRWGLAVATFCPLLLVATLAAGRARRADGQPRFV